MQNNGRRNARTYEDLKVTVYVLGILILLGTLSGAASIALLHKHSLGSSSLWFSSFFTNIGAGCFSSAFTYFIFEWIVERRKKEQQAADQKKMQRIEDLRKKLMDATLSKKGKQDALDEMIREDMLQHIHLEQVDLQGLDLVVDGEPADFSHATLREANFRGVKAPNVKFYLANLTLSDMTNANLRSANFFEAIVRTVRFTDCALEHAVFDKAKAHGAEFCKANLSGASFKRATVTDAPPNRPRIESPAIIDMDTVMPVPGQQPTPGAKLGDIATKIL